MMIPLRSFARTPKSFARTTLIPGVMMGIMLIGSASPVSAQHRPYKVFDTKPVITQGPYLIATSDSTATVVWMTDTPSHSKVLYGKEGSLDEVAEPQVDGLVPVGTRHVVHLRELEPGTTYSYQVVSTQVVKLNAYWPDKGRSAESPRYRFTTLDPQKGTATFSFLTDTHEDVDRLNDLLALVDWETTDFLIHGGDAFHSLTSEEQLFRNWLGPLSEALRHRTPLVFARGNHELRGPFARELFGYVPTIEGRYYYVRDHGPVHLLVLDSGEDKPDDTNVYADLNRLKVYMKDQFAWLKNHVETSRRLAKAPFRVVAVHQPRWGWVDGENDRWTSLANEAGVDLVISGHHHRFSHTEPGDRDNDYHLLVLGQDQLATIEATADELHVVVKARDGGLVKEFTIKPRSE